MKLQRNVAGAVIISALFGLIVLAMLSSPERHVAAPMLAATYVVFLTGMALWIREGQIPMFEVGLICALATLVYTAIPLLGYLSNGLRFSMDGDPRLFAYQPTPKQLGMFHWRHVVYLLCLCGAYVLSRWRAPRLVRGVQEPSKAMVHTIIIMFVLLFAYFRLLQLATGFSYQSSYQDMTEAYAAGTEVKLPRVLAQISHYLYGWYTLFKLAVLVLVVKRARNRRWLMILLAWMAFEVLDAVITLGPRTWTVMLLLGAIILYHRTVRPIRIRTALILAMAFLWGFLVFGTMRSERKAGVLASGNEFQALLGTAWDVNEKQKRGTLNPPWQIYFHDIMKALPAQQIVPFKKLDGTHWYADEMDPGIRGVKKTGWMWGVMSQVAIGYGVFELMLRGLLLGWLLGWLHVKYARDPTRFIPTLLYLWLCLKVYNTFRDGTFTLITNVVWEVIPVVLILRFLPGMLRRTV